MNRRFTIGAVIAVVIILLGGLGYYIYNRYSADFYTRDFCVGTSGTAWKNCVRNMASWKRYMVSVDNTRFQAFITNADKLRKTVSTSTGTTSTGTTGTTGTTSTGSTSSTTTSTVKGAKITVNNASGVAVKDSAVKATVYVPCNYTDPGGAALVAYGAVSFSGTTDASGNVTIPTADILSGARTSCVSQIKDRPTLGGLNQKTYTSNGTVKPDELWLVYFTATNGVTSQATAFGSKTAGNVKYVEQNIYYSTTNIAYEFSYKENDSAPAYTAKLP